MQNQLILDYIKDGKWGLFEVTAGKDQQGSGNVIATSDSPTDIIRMFSEYGFGQYNGSNSVVLLPAMTEMMVTIEKLDEMRKSLLDMKRRAQAGMQSVLDGKEDQKQLPPCGSAFPASFPATFPVAGTADQPGAGGVKPTRASFGKARRKLPPAEPKG